MELKPEAGSVEITTACSAQCIMCPHPKLAAKPQTMDADQAIEMVRQLVAVGCTTILPHHLGEPTLHPEYPRILRTIRGEHPEIYLKVFTNGSRLLRDEVRDAIADCADYVVVSIDGTTTEMMARVRPGVNPYDVLAGFIELATDPRRGELVTQGVVIPGVNEEEMDGYEERWKARGAHAAYPYRDVRAREAVFPNPCSRIYTQIDIRVNGDVGVCCRDPESTYVLGNAFEEPVRDIWYGEKARAFRGAHRAGEIEMCKTCTWEGVFEGDPEVLE